MKELILENGNITFLTSDGIEGFENRLLNAIQIFSVETYWNILTGISFDVISSNESFYKLEHIKSKILEWYGDEINTLDYKEISINNGRIKAVLVYSYKGTNIENEVII